MRDGEALHHARGALGLAGQEGVHHGVGVACDTGLDGLVGNEAQSLVTRSEVLGDKDVLDLHEVSSLGLGGLDGSGLGGLNGLGYRAAFWFFSKSYFLKATNRMPPTTAPMRIARTQSGPFSTTGRTRKPP